MDTLDAVSVGRVRLGVGAGWNREEMQNHVTESGLRFAIVRERIEAMRQIWIAAETEYHGQHVDFAPVRSWPKPVQRPHPPILIGGEDPRVLERALAYEDGWAPNAEPGFPKRIVELRGLAADRGRGPIPVTAMHVAPDVTVSRAYTEAGASRCAFSLPAGVPVPEVAIAIERLVTVDASRAWA